MSQNLAGLPKGWKVVKLGEIVKLKSGTSRPDNLLPSPTENANVPVFGGNGILGYTSQIFSNDRQLVIGRVGAYCGCVHIANAPNWITDNALYSEKWLTENIVLDFVADCLRFSNLNSLQMKGGQPLITQSILHNFYIALPPLEEQRAIATTLRTIQTAKEARQKELALERERKAALMDYLFTHGTRNEPRKQTELGEIPESWQVVRLGDYCLKSQQTDPTKHPVKSFIYIDISSVSNESFRIVDRNIVLGKDAPSRARKIIRENDIIFATVRPTLKRIALVSDDLDNHICSTGFCVIRANQEYLDPRFTYFFLLSEYVYQKVDYMQKGATYPAVSDSDLYNLELFLPKLEEQQEIADVLSSCDTKIATLEREINLHDELFRAMLEELMTGQLSSLPLAN